MTSKPAKQRNRDRSRHSTRPVQGATVWLAQQRNFALALLPASRLSLDCRTSNKPMAFKAQLSKLAMALAATGSARVFLSPKTFTWLLEQIVPSP
jgi:hypothetical protein